MRLRAAKTASLQRQEEGGRSTTMPSESALVMSPPIPDPMDKVAVARHIVARKKAAREVGKRVLGQNQSEIDDLSNAAEPPPAKDESPSVFISESIIDSDSDSDTHVFEAESDRVLGWNTTEEMDEDEDIDPMEDLYELRDGDGWNASRVSGIFTGNARNKEHTNRAYDSGGRGDDHNSDDFSDSDSETDSDSDSETDSDSDDHHDDDDHNSNNDGGGSYDAGGDNPDDIDDQSDEADDSDDESQEEKGGSKAASDSGEDYTDDEDEGEDGYKPGGYHPVKVGEVYNQR